MPDPHNLNYPNIDSIVIRCVYGAKLKTYLATVRYKNGESSTFSVANPNVFLENV